MDWSIVLELIREFAPLLVDCFNKDKDKAIGNLRNLGPLETLKLRRSLRKRVPRELIGDHVREVRQALANASDEDLLEIFDMAKDAPQVSISISKVV